MCVLNLTSAFRLTDIRNSSIRTIFFHAALEFCSASGMIPDTFFISDYGFVTAAFQNHTMMIDAESDCLMQHDLRSGKQMEEVRYQVDEC